MAYPFRRFSIGWTIVAILSMALLNTVLLIQVDHRVCPKPATWPWWRRRWAELQLFFYPVVGLALSVIPALEAASVVSFMTNAASGVRYAGST